MNGKNPEPEREILTVIELAAYLRVDKSKIYRLLKAHELLGFLAGSDWRFHVGDIDHQRMRAEETPSHGRRRNSR